MSLDKGRLIHRVVGLLHSRGACASQVPYVPWNRPGTPCLTNVLLHFISLSAAVLVQIAHWLKPSCPHVFMQPSPAQWDNWSHPCVGTTSALFLLYFLRSTDPHLAFPLVSQAPTCTLLSPACKLWEHQAGFLTLVSTAVPPEPGTVPSTEKPLHKYLLNECQKSK